MDICMAFSGDVDHGHQHRPLLLHSHRTDMVPQWQQGPGLGYGLKWQYRLTTGSSSLHLCLQTCLSSYCSNRSAPLPLPFFHPILAHHSGLCCGWATQWAGPLDVFKYLSNPKIPKKIKFLTKVKYSIVSYNST